MYYKLSTSQENYLLNQPETGMGYQVVEASKAGNYEREKFLILNSEVVLEMNGLETYLIGMIINEGVFSFKSLAENITLNAMSVLSKNQFRKQVYELKNEREKGATDNEVEFANGEEFFVRLSAFDDDKRIDKINRCLRPGSYTTTKDDYLMCKDKEDDPVERYALPNNDEIKFAFHIKPEKTDKLQRGTVQPANEKRGGGKEVYFANGTAGGTFKEQTPY